MPLSVAKTLLEFLGSGGGASPDVKKLILGDLVNGEIGRFHGPRQFFRQPQLDESVLRVDDGDGKLALSYALRLDKGFLHWVCAWCKGTGRPSVGNQDKHRILRRILPIDHVEQIFRLTQAFGQRRFAPGGHGRQFLLGEIDAARHRKKHLGLMFFFLLTYRLGESQLVKIASPFLLDKPAAGGLELSTTTVGMIYGTIGVVALLLGGILGGIVVSRHGFRRWLLPMALAINLPDALYIYLSAVHPAAWQVIVAVAIEQLGYGFGFTAYMLYLIYIAEGEHKTAHYAIGTGFMALGMMLPGMAAGWIQDTVGYTPFFVWVCLCTLPGILASVLVRKKIDPAFGRKGEA